MKRSLITQLVRLLAAMVFFIGALSLIGYATGNEFLRRWTMGGSDMAMNTAFCFCAVAVALFLLTLNGGNGVFKEVV